MKLETRCNFEMPSFNSLAVKILKDYLDPKLALVFLRKITICFAMLFMNLPRTSKNTENQNHEGQAKTSIISEEQIIFTLNILQTLSVVL